MPVSVTIGGITREDRLVPNPRLPTTVATTEALAGTIDAR
jgi:hypothetical protein